MDPQAAKHSTPESDLANIHNREPIKSLSNVQRKKVVIITKCLCDPCPVFYTDSIFESLLIECKDLRHSLKSKERKVGYQFK